MAIITESQWVNYFGFQRFPFDRPEAGNEEFARPDFLASCFVEPRGFERVFGQADSPVTSLLFAARGIGKTACRVMMDYYCQNGLAHLSSPNVEPSYVLSVPHIRLDNVREIARRASPQSENPEIRVEHHAEEIMRQAIPVFVDAVARNPAFADQVKRLPRGDFEDLSFYLIYYYVHLLPSQREYLRGLGIDMPLGSEPMEKITGGFLYKQKLELSPLQHLEQLAKMMPKIGILATYVLVDGVDELMESAGDPFYAHYLIRSLLTHLRLMDETHHLALKFFLPSDMEQTVISDPSFRRDRGFIIQKIEWREEDLINILRKRLTALSRPDSEIRDQTASSFDTLCVPELRGDIENDLAQNANGNPRYLMNLCAQMVTAHCSREIKNQDNIFELNRDDYLDAIERVKSIYRKISINQKFQGGEVLHGRYRVEKIINTSHSQIIKAWDESLKRFVAIKSPNIEQFNLDESLVERFHKNLRREAELLAKLRHQNIGQAFDILEEPFGVIIEWIDGWSLHEILYEKERLSVYDILMIGIGVADALAYAHHNGVIHRDINPKNIILTLDKIAKLIDFDAARYDLLETITKREDGSRFLVGTPRYSSPEQLAQPNDVSLNEIGPASDIFSLGVVLYELLTVEIPYEYGNRLTQYADNVFPKPKSYEIPKPLYKILIGMLDGKTSRRPKAEDLKHELQNCVQTLKLTDRI